MEDDGKPKRCDMCDLIVAGFVCSVCNSYGAVKLSGFSTHGLPIRREQATWLDHPELDAPCKMQRLHRGVKRATTVLVAQFEVLGLRNSIV